MNFEVGEMRARVAARACSWGRARMRGARALRSPLETCGGGRQGRWGSRQGSRGTRLVGARKPGLCPDPATAARLGTVPHLLLQLAPTSLSANFQAPGVEPGGVEGSREEKGLNGRVGGFAGGGAANGLSAGGEEGADPTPNPEGGILSLISSPGFSSFPPRERRRWRQEAWKGVCPPSPHCVSGFGAPVMAISPRSAPPLPGAPPPAAWGRAPDALSVCVLCIAHVPDLRAPGVVPVSPGARAGGR